MNTYLIKKIVLAIIGVILFIVFLYVFFYVALFILLVGLILYIYYKLFKQDKKKSNTNKKPLNNVIMDAEYKEKK